MKQILKLTTLLALIFLLGSCSDEEKLDGYSDDNIKLSTKLVSFDKNENTAIITTKGDGWWINGVSVNGKNYSRLKDYTIDVTSDSYVVKDDCFIVEKKNKTTLNIKVDENDTGAEREIVVYLQAGNYYDHIAVTQKAK